MAFVTNPLSLSGVTTMFEQPDIVSGHEDNIYQINFSVDGRWMVTASGDNTAMLWSGPPWKMRHTLPHAGPVYSAVFSRDQRQVVTASGDGHLAIWSICDGKRLLDRQKHADAVYDVACAPRENILASVGGNGAGGDTVCRLWSADTLGLLQEYHGHAFPVYGVSFSPDGKWLATSSRDKTVRIWRLRDGHCRILTDHTSDVHRCAFSPNSQWLVTASQDATVRVWDVIRGTCVTTLQGERDPFYAVAFSADGSKLAAVGDDFTLRIWSMGDFRPLWKQQLTQDALYTVTRLPGDIGFCVGGADTLVRLWRVPESP